MLRNALRLLMFSLFMVALLPLFIVGMVGFMVRLKTRNRGISATAYEPLFSRLIFHYAGTRDDRAAVRLAPHLPALSPTVAWLLIGTMGLAARLSGYQGSFLSYPGARPSSMALAMVHRTAFFDEALASAVDPTGPHPAQQVVFLGAGWDTRAAASQRRRSLSKLHAVAHSVDIDVLRAEEEGRLPLGQPVGLLSIEMRMLPFSS